MAPSNQNETNGLVLVVDDNQVSRTLHAELVRKLGFQPLCLDDTYDLVFSLKYFTTITAILIDMNIPLLNGYKATKKIRNLYKNLNRPGHLPIIAVSEVQGSENKSLKAGCDLHLKKPASLHCLTEAFKKVGCII